MTDHFREYAPRLIDNGYLVVPIRKGEKRPAISSWQNARMECGDFDKFPGHGVGVLCGQGDHPVVGVDIDVSHPKINAALVDWCCNHLGYAPQRVGSAPRLLLVYRASRAGWSKGRSVQWFDSKDPLKADGKENVQQVEILSLGQQFVAYHEHPDVHRDYDWVDMLGGLVEVPAADLPEVTEAQMDALLVEVARLVRSTPGMQPRGTSDAPAYRSGSDDDDLLSLSAKVGKPFAEVAEIVGFLPNDGDGYDHWLNVGAALHHEFHGTEHEQDALDLWHTYGARSSKDDPRQYDYKWKSFGKSGGRPTTLRWLLKIAHLAKREHEHESKLAQAEQFKALLSEQDDLVKLGSKPVLEKLRAMLPPDPLLRDQAVFALQVHHKKISGATLGIEKARTLLFGPKVRDVTSARTLTEFGNAERMMDRYGSGMMYVPEVDTWYLWTGVHWRAAAHIEIEHLAKETVRALHTEAEFFDDPKEFYGFCAASQTAKMVNAMLTLARSDPRVAVPARELDSDRNLLGVQNGVVDLSTGTLLPADPSHRITLVCTCDYNPAAKAPLFMKTLHDAFSGDKQMVEYLLTLLGYSLLGQPSEDVLVIPFGEGANGKSTIFGAVRHAFGGYARSVDPSTFVSDGKAGNSGGAREDLVRLRGARLIYVNESDENGELREGSVKTMTGGDEITARAMYAKKSIEIEPTWVVFMPTNHKPIIKGDDHGIWRRMELVPFMRNFDRDPTIVRDKLMKDKVKAEGAGILALAVQASLRYRSEGLPRPAKVTEAKASYRSQMDLLSEWLDECCDVASGLVCGATELWKSWEMFAKNRGILQYVRSANALGRRLENRFPAFKSAGGARKRSGIALKAFTD